VCRSAGISEATFYNWWKKYGGLLPSEMKRLKQIEEENNKLKKLVAELSLDKAMLQDVIKRKLMTPGRRRQAVDDLRGTWKVSIRRACSVLGAERSSYHYKSRRPDRANLRAKIKEIAETHVRYGNRRVHVLLRREGWVVNVTLVNRLYREMDLAIAQQIAKTEGQGQAA